MSHDYAAAQAERDLVQNNLALEGGEALLRQQIAVARKIAAKEPDLDVSSLVVAMAVNVQTHWVK